MPNVGVVSIVVSPVARRRNLLLWALRNPSSVVQDWPEAGTNCRSSVQIGHAPGGVWESGYCVPQAAQMKAGMKAGYTSPSAAASVSNLDQGQLSPDALALSCGWLSSASIQKPTSTGSVMMCTATVID